MSYRQTNPTRVKTRAPTFAELYIIGGKEEEASSAFSTVDQGRLAEQFKNGSKILKQNKKANDDQGRLRRSTNVSIEDLPSEIKKLLQEFLHPKDRAIWSQRSREFAQCLEMYENAVNNDPNFAKNLGGAVSNRRLVVNQDSATLDTAIRILKDLKENLDGETPVGKYVECLLNVGPKITVQIDHSPSCENFMEKCRQLHLVAPSLVVFALGSFKWVPNFLSFNNEGYKNVLSRIEKICGVSDSDIRDENRSFPKTTQTGRIAAMINEHADLSALKNLRYIGKRACPYTTGNVNLKDCTSLTTIEWQAFYFARGSVDLSGCTSLKTIADDAFLYAEGDVNLKNCESLETIGQDAFASAEGDVNLRGCTQLKTIDFRYPHQMASER